MEREAAGAAAEASQWPSSTSAGSARWRDGLELAATNVTMEYAPSLPLQKTNQLSDMPAAKRYGWLLFLRHSLICHHGDQCPLGQQCRLGRVLWQHMGSCSSPACKFPRCSLSRELLRQEVKAVCSSRTGRTPPATTSATAMLAAAQGPLPSQPVQPASDKTCSHASASTAVPSCHFTLAHGLSRVSSDATSLTSGSTHSEGLSGCGEEGGSHGSQSSNGSQGNCHTAAAVLHREARQGRQANGQEQQEQQEGNKHAIGSRHSAPPADSYDAASAAGAAAAAAAVARPSTARNSRMPY